MNNIYIKVTICNETLSNKTWMLVVLQTADAECPKLTRKENINRKPWKTSMLCYDCKITG